MLDYVILHIVSSPGIYDFRYHHLEMELRSVDSIIIFEIAVKKKRFGFFLLFEMEGNFIYSKNSHNAQVKFQCQAFK
jgi:hypothetical protein